MSWIRHIVAMLCIAWPADIALAQANYPDKPIRLLVGFAPAGPADIAARVLGDKLAEAWGKPIVIENVTGAASNVATDRVAKAAPDGYTLLLAASATIVTNLSLYEKLAVRSGQGFGCRSRRFASRPTSWPSTTTCRRRACRNWSRWRARSRATLTFGSAGVGTSQHLAGELFKTMAGINLQHVPYRGIAQVMPDLLGGRLTMVFGNISAMLPLAREGKLRALAVTSLKRSASAPDLPTMAEQGFPGLRRDRMVRPDGARRHARADLEEAPRRDRPHPGAARRAQEIRRAWHGAIGNTPAEFAAVIKAEIPQWAKVIKESGAKVTE